MTGNATQPPLISAAEVAAATRDRDVCLLDVREAFEFGEERIPGAESAPLSTLDARGLASRLGGREVVLVCRSGARARDAAARLAAAGLPTRVLDGGLLSWREAGQALERPGGAPMIPVMRQVQIAAGLLVLLGVVLGATVSPWFLAISAFVGGGLVFAGLTGWCGMALLLSRMPWNRAASAAVALSLTLVGSGACAEPVIERWAAADAEALGDVQRAQLERATAARGALFGSLLGELTSALDGGDAAAAIEVCSRRAPELAARVAAEHGVAIGRTSSRLRNPANTPPPWALDAVAEGRRTPGVFVSDTGTLGALHPILVGETCLRCHGSEASLAPEVKEALGVRYPSDRATGYAEGDLRGWFWVEVPSP